MSHRYIVNLHLRVFILGRILFALPNKKSNLIKTLAHRTLMIWSEYTLDSEIMFISDILCHNGFPLSVVQTVVTKKKLNLTKLNKHQYKSAQFIYIFLGRANLTNCTKVLFFSQCTLNPFWHLSLKMFFLLIIIIHLFTCLEVAVVCATLEELTRG